jgi:ABC-2 type transport system permease protein
MMDSAAAANLAPIRLTRLPNFRAMGALFVLALRQQLRGSRPVILGLLFLLPAGLTTLVYLTMPPAARRPSLPADLEFAFLFNLIPHALAPLAALLCSGGIIRDEIEEQTLTYLLLRPVSRPAIYAVKLMAALTVSALFTAIFSLATMLYIATLTGGDWTLLQGAKVVAVFSLAQVAYCGLFALLALLMRRALLVGLLYIIFFEGVMVGFDIFARKATVMYYFRVLVLRWLKPPLGSEWRFDMLTAPSAGSCIKILLAAGLVLTLFGAWVFAIREFRMKTAEGE